MHPWERTVSGDARGLLASGARSLLRGMSWGYAMGVAMRNRRFDRHPEFAFCAEVPVISVGNITCGGTGKTPVVAWLANELVRRGKRPGILSRGYRSIDGEENDEKRVLATLCPNVPHWQNRDRVAIAREAASQVDILILDDGFQHRRLHRDRDIVLIDAVAPWGHGYLLPRGLLREPKKSLRRSDVVVITRCDQVSDFELAALRSEIRGQTDSPILTSSFPASRLRNGAGEVAPLPKEGTRVAAFCGIGNPQGFRNTLEQLGCQVETFREFADHHHYAPDDLAPLKSCVGDCDYVLTTMKDLVKLPNETINGVPIFAVEIGFHAEEASALLGNLDVPFSAAA